ncbi:hypothetical protein [Azoarcus taiwanensis]|uniref:Uncharacterized protein n=1 Tax=Azoarcus taiwanensis TaxID=666964 RepID=A0A972FHZ9_9RHOO|nr:hypothetical protein [Azoarcus taiwanensis]NMG02656.1 hypothetical protein [Azoarcus taiwanensis]
MHSSRTPSKVTPFLLAVLSITSLTLGSAGSHAADRIAGGFEIVRQGSSPHARDFAVMLVKGTPAQCELLGRPFQLVGDPATVGNFEVIEYHHPGLQKSRITKRTAELVTTAVCRLEVLQREATVITHHEPRSRTVHTREVNPVTGPQPWSSRNQPPLGRASLELIRQAFSLQSLEAVELRGGSHSIATAPDLPETEIAGRKCRWITLVPPPAEGRLCLMPEGIGMPINEALSAEMIGAGSDGPAVLLRDEVVSFRGPIALSSTLFEPEDKPLAIDSAKLPNATTDWCREQAARTGTDPCAHDGPDQITDHFDALIDEWCAYETERIGHNPCAEGPGAYSDTRVMRAMTDWCAHEAARTGVNRCEEFDDDDD